MTTHYQPLTPIVVNSPYGGIRRPGLDIPNGTEGTVLAEGDFGVTVRFGEARNEQVIVPYVPLHWVKARKPT